MSIISTSISSFRDEDRQSMLGTITDRTNYYCDTILSTDEDLIKVVIDDNSKNENLANSEDDPC